MLAACAPGDDPDASTVPEDPMGRLVIAELYYSGAAPAAGTARLLVAALLFYASDLCVARERFVEHAPVNRYVGLPLYYAGQLLFALG